MGARQREEGAGLVETTILLVKRIFTFLTRPIPHTALPVGAVGVAFVFAVVGVGVGVGVEEVGVGVLLAPLLAVDAGG